AACRRRRCGARRLTHSVRPGNPCQHHELAEDRVLDPARHPHRQHSDRTHPLASASRLSLDKPRWKPNGSLCDGELGTYTEPSIAERAVKPSQTQLLVE